MMRKPESISVLQWINRIISIHVYLPLMAENALKLTEYELTTKVIARNIPPSWVRPFHLMELHLKETVESILDKLLIMEDQYREKKPQNQKHAQGKHLKNPFRVHNGTQEWDDCWQNPKNQRNNKDDKDSSNRDSKGEQSSGMNGQSREEQRNTEDRDACQQRRVTEDSDDYESNCLITVNDKQTPSSEILVAIPRDKGSKKYKTFLGLTDTGSSSSLLNKNIVEFTSFAIESSTKKILWDTQAGSFKTNSSAMLENYFLPEFTTQRKVTSKFHLFNKIKEDGYDIIIGRDILKNMGLQIHYETESFVWDDIKVKMVPRKHWDKTSIKTFWQNREVAEKNQLAEIKPVEYQVADLQKIVEEQTHLLPLERAKLYSTLSEFGPLFQGMQGSYKGAPIDLEL
jgi:hypothetical protein